MLITQCTQTTENISGHTFVFIYQQPKYLLILPRKIERINTNKLVTECELFFVHYVRKEQVTLSSKYFMSSFIPKRENFCSSDKHGEGQNIIGNEI